ncbi:MAG: hydrolase [Clostridiaceae bacterium]|jgi:L-ascorbate metabolism protein UlaG (beta-lactamase superfamily)|nr:hydrolase [Clostridiaceae bacterium]
MNKYKATIYFIYHSGFAVKTNNHFLIFDFYKKPVNMNGSTKKLLNMENFNKMQNLFVFASHSHGDHFNPEILEFEKYNPHIEYVLSSDINIEKKHNYNIISEGEEQHFQNLSVKAYGSTDIGISFLVKVDGLTIFHAGDLNWWHWKEDSAEERSLAEISFKSEIEKLKIENSIDIAFFPVDPRLEEFYYIGGKYFTESIKPKMLIPMHFGDNLKITKEFKNKIIGTTVNIVELNDFGQQIVFN